MSRTSVLAMLAGSAVGLGVTAASAQSTGPDEQAAYRAEVAADAAGRTSLLRDDLVGEGAMFQSGSASLDIGGLVQARYFLNFREDEIDSDEDFANGFEINRTKLWFEGDLNEDWSYRVEGDFNNVRHGGESGDLTLEDAYADWKLSDNIFVRIGQFRGPFSREELIRAWNLQTPERSIANEIFTAGIVQGVMVGWEDDQFGAYLSVNDGVSTANTPFFSTGDSDVAITGRVEWIFAGNRDQLADLAGWRGQDYAGLIGGAVHYQSGGETGAPGGVTSDIDFIRATVDVQVEGSGWNVFGAGYYSYSDFGTSTLDIEDIDDFGVVGQGGFFVMEQLEVFGRYSALFPESRTSSGTGNTTFHTATLGLNYYDIPESQASKFTAGVTIFFNSTTDNALLPGYPGPGFIEHIGLLADEDDPQIAAIFQYQLVF